MTSGTWFVLSTLCWPTASACATWSRWAERSSGAYQALEWGILYPDFARGLLLYAGAACGQTGT